MNSYSNATLLLMLGELAVVEVVGSVGCGGGLNGTCIKELVVTKVE